MAAAPPGVVGTCKRQRSPGADTGPARGGVPWTDAQGQTRYVPLREYLERFLSRTKDLVTYYNMSEGLEFPDRKVEERFRIAVNAQRMLRGEGLLSEWPHGVDKVLLYGGWRANNELGDMWRLELAPEAAAAADGDEAAEMSDGGGGGATNAAPVARQIMDQYFGDRVIAKQSKREVH